MRFLILTLLLASPAGAVVVNAPNFRQAPPAAAPVPAAVLTHESRTFPSEESAGTALDNARYRLETHYVVIDSYVLKLKRGRGFKYVIVFVPKVH